MSNPTYPKFARLEARKRRKPGRPKENAYEQAKKGFQAFERKHPEMKRKFDPWSGR